MCVAFTLCAGLACRALDLFSWLFDPQEAHLGAEVGSVSDVREVVFRVTGGAGRHAGPVRHRVVVDVLGQDSAFLEEDSVGEPDVDMWFG